MAEHKAQKDNGDAGQASATRDAGSAPAPLLQMANPGVRAALQRRIIQRKASANAEGEAAGKHEGGEHASGEGSSSTTSSASHDQRGTGPQKTANLDLLYAQAAVAREQLAGIAQGVAAKCHGEASVPALKGRERATQKINADYGGDASHLTDIARGSVICKTMDDVHLAAKAVPALATVQRMKDRFANPVGGYRDILYNLDVGGHISELQIQLEAIQAVKSGPGHKLYQKIRDIEDKAKVEHRKLTAEEAARIAELRAEMEGKYDEAFNSATAGKAVP